MKRTLAILGILACAMTVTTGLLMWGEPAPAEQVTPIATAASSDLAP